MGVDTQTAVGGGDLGGLVGIHPDLALSALKHGRCQAFLDLEQNHLDRRNRL